MTDQLNDTVLYHKGLAVLEDKLGPIETLRFLALVSHQPFDYQQWREQHFAGVDLNEIVNRSRTHPE